MTGAAQEAERPQEGYLINGQIVPDEARPNPFARAGGETAMTYNCAPKPPTGPTNSPPTGPPTSPIAGTDTDAQQFAPPPPPG